MTAFFFEHAGMAIESSTPGASRCVAVIAPHHFNTAGVVHGGVLFTLADTGMGAALYPALEKGSFCTTVEIKISYFKPVTAGRVVCDSKVIHQGRRLAAMESELRVDDVLVAKAAGTFAILQRS
jgi:acyl-CoA thioesterase